MTMTGYKVITAEEMARLEKGGDSEKYMERAGLGVAQCVVQHIEAHGLPKKITLLVGKGNNGGDAYVAGLCLLEKGYEVIAYALYDDVSPLNQKFREKFRKKQGQFGKTLEGLIIDGLLGTGFKGKLDAKMQALIEKANASHLPIIAIDIPSGLHGTTGEVNPIAIRAKETITLGFMKFGLFIREGWNHVGKVHLVDFGLPLDKIPEAVAYIPKQLDLPEIVRTRHKYDAGLVIGFAGSKKMPGAAKLAAYAALRAGAGMVRLFPPEEIGDVPLEVICSKWNSKEWKEALKKAKSVFIGPGLGSRSEWLKKHLKTIKLPCVIDADAIIPNITYPKKAILTPHQGEVLRLLGLKNAPIIEELFAKIIRFCTEKELYVVLKGAPTFIFGPKHHPIIIPRGDPGMATAGSGDVLTGIIAALLAQGCGTYEAAILGVSLHALSGEFAAEELTSYCLTAQDLLNFLPAAFHYVLEGHNIV